MPKPTNQLDRFVTALHRRLVVIRVLECAGLGALAGCAVAAALIPVLLWRDRPALPPSLGLLLIGAASGLAWGFVCRPTRLHAAAEADRQLGLADLFGTALTVAPRSRESDRDADAAPWLETVQALADAASRAHAPSEVILHRLHARAWGGIALAALLVLSLAALVENQPTADASARRVADGTPTRNPQSPELANTPEASSRAARATHAPSASGGPVTGPDRDDTGRTTHENSDGAPAEIPASPGGQNATSGDNGAGGGNAKANRPAVAAPLPAAADAVARSSSDQGVAGGGAGAVSVARPSADHAAPGSSGGASTPSPATPPWRSPAWPADVARANAAVEGGRVPAAHRDLVRQYFSRP